MENAIEALKIAFGVMIFVMALSISVSGFTQARMTLQQIVELRVEEESFVKDANGNYLNYVNFDSSAGGIRTVEVNDIISSLYRACNENLKICFYPATGNSTTFTNFGLIKGKDDSENIYYYFDMSENGNLKTEEDLTNAFTADSQSFYKYLSSHKFREKLGEYYMEDKTTPGADTAESNKTKKREIIYEEISET